MKQALSEKIGAIPPKYLIAAWAIVSFAIAFLAKLASGAGVPVLATISASCVIFCLLAILGRVRIFFLGFLALLGADLVLRLEYGSAISISVWASIAGAHFSEYVAFVQDNFLIALLAIPASILALFIPAPPLKKLAQPAGISALLLAAPIFSGWNGNAYQDYSLKRYAMGVPELQMDIEYSVIRMSESLPALESLVGLAQAVSYFTPPTAPPQTWANAHVASETAPKLLVLVIGESLRADHMSVYGYDRNTTPNLQADRASLGIYAAYSGGTNTWNALPSGLTKYSGTGDLSLSIVTLAKSAGYEVHWLSNQPANDEWGMSVSKIAQQADYSISLPHGKVQPLDEALLPNFTKSLEQFTANDQKMLIVLQLYASHSSFADRYPANYSKFETTGKASHQASLLDAYDNSVLYTDAILATLRQETRKANGSLMFIADHGLTKDTLRHDIRKAPALDSLQVPMIIDGPSAHTFAPSKAYSLYYFECVFSAWSGITADQLTVGDYCANSMAKLNVTYLNSSMTKLEATVNAAENSVQ